MQTILDIHQKIEIESFYYDKDEVIRPHSSLWGDFNFSLNGLLELTVAQCKYLSPPNYAIWVPPHTAHCSLAIDNHLTHYVCIRIHPSLCHLLAERCKTLSLSPFLRQSVVEYLEHQQLATPNSNYQRHLTHIIFDQICMAPMHDQYLPYSKHPLLEQVLCQLGLAARFDHSLSQVLSEFNLSERQLSRLSQQHLGLTLSEWRNRAKVIYAVEAIRQGKSIKNIAYMLGYQNSSSFIEFVKRYTGQTPAQFRDH